jgi:nucleoside-diphosphate-sugar epimerase
LKRVVVIGAQGFVGSALVRHLRQRPVELIEVTRQNYPQRAGSRADVVIQAACNSKKYLADDDPVAEFDLSVAHCLRTLRDFPASLHVHISSVDVYADLADPSANTEESPIDVARISHYGLHKLLAEKLVRHYADRWLIVRLAGMVGPGLRKNPVFDILHHQPLRIHPESQYQFAPTDFVAEGVWRLVEDREVNQVFNLCGRGSVSPRQIAELAGRKLDLSLVGADARPRVVDINVRKVSRLFEMPLSLDTVQAFIQAYPLQERATA